MAKKLTPGAAAESKKNSAARDEIIRDVTHKCAEIDEKISALQATRREQRGRIKELDLKMADYDAMVRLGKIEDPEVRQRSVDSMQEIFNALEIGEQGSLFGGDEEASDSGG